MQRKISEEPPDSSLLKKGGVLIKESPKERGSFFVEKKILIETKISERGLQINVNKKSFSINFPKIIWENCPLSFKEIFSENLAFALTLHLPYLLNSNSLIYKMPEPETKEIISQGFQLSLPATALMKNEKTSKLLKKFSQIKYQFNGRKNSSFDPPLRKLKKEGILLFSFGKDSLLTFSLCKEIGIKPIPIYVKEPLTLWENYHKERLAKEFSQEFNQEILFLENEAGKLREPGKSGWYGWELQLTQFGLMFLPIAFSKRASYLFFANEQSCNDQFLDEEGFFCNPVYEQSVDWTLKFEKMAKILGLKNIKVSSLIEPLHEIAIIKILHSRYPEIGKYQMSCGEILEKITESRWCGNCSKCARIYIFLLANNIDPKRVGFPHDMLEFKYKNRFALFEDGNGKNYGYDKARLGRDEQLLAFLLAWRNGGRGDLIDLFKSLYLKEAEKREKELRKKYFGIHSTTTIPNEIKDKVLKIYKEELKDLQ